MRNVSDEIAQAWIGKTSIRALWHSSLRLSTDLGLVFHSVLNALVSKEPHEILVV